MHATNHKISDVIGSNKDIAISYTWSEKWKKGTDNNYVLSIYEHEG